MSGPLGLCDVRQSSVLLKVVVLDGEHHGASFCWRRDDPSGLRIADWVIMQATGTARQMELPLT